jgi:hypothetical protein
MDKLENYRCCIQNLLEEYLAQGPVKEGVESQLLMDSQRHHYQWMRVGWSNRQRTYHVVMHLDIKDGKVWIQQNMTDIDLAQALMEAGVAREDIVLGLQPEYKRGLNGFAIA